MICLKMLRTALAKTIKSGNDNQIHQDFIIKRVNDRLPIYSVRIGMDYRAIGILKNDTITWFWIGKHDEYERILKSL
jgi:hypothetical protein